jgi:hypothetical protein
MLLLADGIHNQLDVHKWHARLFTYIDTIVRCVLQGCKRLKRGWLLRNEYMARVVAIAEGGWKRFDAGVEDYDRAYRY